MSWRLLIVMLAACGADPTPRETVHAVPSSVQSAPSARSAPSSAPASQHEVRVEVLLRPRGANERTFWLYLPTPMPTRVGLVLVAPAGGNLLSGRALTADDRPEHMPYARAGFVVMAYSVDGDLPAGVSDVAATRALRDYQAAQAGVENARAALDLALEKVPGIDGSLVFAAGHGSAGSLALLLAAEEPRVRGALAYAPQTGLDGHGASTVMSVDRVITGYGKLVRWSLPENRVADIGVPLFIYHSRDDEVMRASLTDDYVERLRAAAKTVDCTKAPSGSHHEGMLDDGIPRGLAWLRNKRGD